jgi:DNA-binding Lrp family transcriptional regulator
VKAFVLIETAMGKSREVVTVIGKLKGVISVDAVTGSYDVVVVVQGDSLNEIGDLAAKIHPVPGICRIVTCVVE